MSENGLNVEKTLNILDRIIRFVDSCDKKTSIALAFYGALLTIFLSSENLKILHQLINNAYYFGKCLGKIYLLAFACSAVMYVYGMYKLLKAIFPQIKEKHFQQEGIENNSIIFFGDICRNKDYLKYRSKVDAISEEDMLNDIFSQIYINSLICDTKFKNYKTGIKITTISLSIFIILWILGLFVY
ncbi:MAG: hypothetical protein GX451_03215 [Acholeplasmataceae bacterium]|nr:hypothetical protein [Acholeplasmataceae bacterium]